MAETVAPTVARIWLVVHGHRADPATVRFDLERLLYTGFWRSGVWAVKNGAMALYVRRSAVS